MENDRQRHCEAAEQKQWREKIHGRKLEIRNPKFETISKSEVRNTFLDIAKSCSALMRHTLRLLRISNFGIVSSFDIRVSSLASLSRESFYPASPLHSFAQEIEQHQFQRPVGDDSFAGDAESLATRPQSIEMRLQFLQIFFARGTRVDEKRPA